MRGAEDILFYIGIEEESGEFYQISQIENIEVQSYIKVSLAAGEIEPRPLTVRIVRKGKLMHRSNLQLIDLLPFLGDYLHELALEQGRPPAPL